MQLTQVTPCLIDPGGAKGWLLVKVATDEGLTGWGEAYTQADREPAILAHVESMGRYLVGRSPFAIKPFSQVMYLDYALRRPTMECWSAPSALEQAPWDIAGSLVLACNPRAWRATSAGEVQAWLEVAWRTALTRSGLKGRSRRRMPMAS